MATTTIEAPLWPTEAEALAAYVSLAEAVNAVDEIHLQLARLPVRRSSEMPVPTIAEAGALGFVVEEVKYAVSALEGWAEELEARADRVVVFAINGYRAAMGGNDA